MKESEPASLVYSIDEAASLLGIGRGAAYEAVKRGDLPVIRIGRLIKVPKAALLKMLETAQPKGGEAA